MKIKYHYGIDNIYKNLKYNYMKKTFNNISDIKGIIKINSSAFTVVYSNI